jgi:hypothetical protein
MIPDIRSRMPLYSHRRFSFLKQATALFSAILVLALTVLAASPDLHQRLHGHAASPANAASRSATRTGQQTDDDGDGGCVVTLFAQGIVLTIAVLALEFTGQVARVFGGGMDDRIAVAAPRFLLLPSQAPPLGLG